MLWDEAVFRGPPDGNYGGPMVEVRGCVEHIAEGSLEGTISWQRNPASDVSSHFVIGLNGEIAQMLDTSVTAWTQGAGNGHWVSVENAGFHTSQFTPAQIEANARLYAWLMVTHAAPATLATTPSGRGLGYHGMGGAAWGNHPLCPGPANVALLPTILARAIEIANGEDDDMQQYFITADGAPGHKDTKHYLCDGMLRRGPLNRPASSGQSPVGPDDIADIKELARLGMFKLWRDGEIYPNTPPAAGLPVPWTGVGGLVPHTHVTPALSLPAGVTGPAKPSA